MLYKTIKGIFFSSRFLVAVLVMLSIYFFNIDLFCWKDMVYHSSKTYDMIYLTVIFYSPMKPLYKLLPVVAVIPIISNNVYYLKFDYNYLILQRISYKRYIINRMLTQSIVCGFALFMASLMFYIILALFGVPFYNGDERHDWQYVKVWSKNQDVIGFLVFHLTGKFFLGAFCALVVEIISTVVNNQTAIISLIFMVFHIIQKVFGIDLVAFSGGESNAAGFLSLPYNAFIYYNGVLFILIIILAILNMTFMKERAYR